MGIAMSRFFVETFFKVFGSGQSDVRSGKSMTSCCVVNATRGNLRTELGPPVVFLIQILLIFGGRCNRYF